MSDTEASPEADARTTHDRLLDAALESFGTKGYDATSLDQLANELGVRKQTILYYHPSKVALLDAVIDRSATELTDALEDAAARSGGGFDRIEAIVRSVFRLAVRRPELLGLLREVTRLGPPASNRILDVFEPMIDAWAKKLPADVDFRRVPVAFRDEPFVAHQRIYYALEEMGLVDAMHRKVFAAIHVDHQRLDNPTEISAFMAKNGVDAAKFMGFYNSFSVQTKARQAAQLAQAYKIDGVPSLGIAGKYFTSGTLAGSPQASLAVTDYLIQRVRAKT